MRFENKCVLITGGGSGIGRATALGFAREGANVAVADISIENAGATAREVTALGRKAVSVHLNVCDPRSVADAVERAETQLGPVDVLVNSAGVREIIPFLELSFEEWQRVITTNLGGTFLCSQFVARRMIANGRAGKIINLASAAGLVAVPNRAAYVSSKHAVVGLTKEMALELAAKQIQVNAVAPGVVETPMTATYFQDPSTAEATRRLHAAGRWAQPKEVADMILFLASAEADFVTGATFSIDGGFTAGRPF